MAQPAFQTYQQFPSNEAALPLLALLNEHNIPYETKADRPYIDPSFAFNAVHSGFLVKIRPEDKIRVDALQEEQDRRLIQDADPDHYLFAFTDAELMDVLAKRQEWSRFDVLLAEDILQARGHSTDVAGLNQLQDHREAQPPAFERSHPGWIVAGYIMALLGGLVGIFIGLHLYWHRRTLPDGTKSHAYSPADRAHGLRIMGLGGLALIAWRLVRAWL